MFNESTRINSSKSSKFNFFISVITDTQNNIKNTNSLDFEKAIKAYEDEYITGLTEEEIEKINEEIARYKEENKLETKEDYNALQSFIEGLLQNYGFKGDISEMSKSFMNVSGTYTTDKNVALYDIIKSYNMLKNLNYRI